MTDNDHAPARAGGAYRLERSIGTTSGISIELWRSATSSSIELVVCPTVQGFRMIAHGGAREADMLAGFSDIVLRALESTAPLLTDEWFRDP